MSTLRTFNLQHPESSNNNIQLAEGGGVSVTAGILTATNVSSTNVTTTEVTATNGTFSGNLSVSGVLTYEDTTNVDSVGVVTARSGIHVTGGSVGIGTDTIDANSQLHIKNTSGNAKITLETNETYDSYINFSGATSEASIGYEPTNNAVVISNAADGLTSAERLRITSAGESKFTVGTNKYVKFYAATHNDEADLGAGLAFSRPSDGADMLSGMFAHSDVGLGIAARDHVTILTGGTSTVSDTEERVRITSDGKVGINSITPTARLDINHPHTEQGLVVRSRYGNIATAMVKFDGDPDSDGGDGNVLHLHGGSSRTDSEILHINSTGEGTCFQIRGDGLTRVYKQLQLEHASNVPKIIFNEYGANDPKAQIEMDQVSSSAGQLIFRTQNSGTLSERLRILSGGGITFNGDTAVANALDDYEEGTWQPVVTSNGTNPSYSVTNNYSYYIKIGRLVHFNVDFYATISSVGSGGSIYISIPFTVDTSSSNKMEQYVGGMGGRAQTAFNLSRQEIGWYYASSVMYMRHQNKDTYDESGSIGTGDLRSGQVRFNLDGWFYSAS